MKLDEFSQGDFERASKRLVRSLTRGKTTSSQPKAILLGGQSGAGKTTIHRVKQREFQGNLIIIDGDSYRSFHPNYLGLQEKYGKDSVDYTKVFTAQLLTTRGYQVSLALIATKPELSYLSTLIRYEELYVINPRQARATPKAHHDGIVEHLVENLRELEKDQLFRQIQIYQRDQSCVYDSQVDQTSAAEVLQECLFGKWTKVEEEMLKLGQERLKEFNTETKK